MAGGISVLCAFTFVYKYLVLDSFFLAYEMGWMDGWVGIMGSGLGLGRGRGFGMGRHGEQDIVPGIQHKCG